MIRSVKKFLSANLLILISDFQLRKRKLSSFWGLANLLVAFFSLYELLWIKPENNKQGDLLLPLIA